MNNNISLKIVVAETSVIVRSGLAAVLKRIPNLNAHPIEVSSPEALQNYIHLHTPDMVRPAFLQDRPYQKQHQIHRIGMFRHRQQRSERV